MHEQQYKFPHGRFIFTLSTSLLMAFGCRLLPLHLMAVEHQS